MPRTKRPTADLTAREMIGGALICGTGTALAGYFVIPAFDDTFPSTPLSAVAMGVWVAVFFAVYMLAMRAVARRHRVNGTNPDDIAADH
jgi:hypothetical protein